MSDEKWVVLGHSYGELLVQCYMAKYPDSIAGVVLVGARDASPTRFGSRQQDYISDAERAAIRAIYSRNDLPLEVAL